MTKRMFINKWIAFWLVGLVLIYAAVLTFVVINNGSRSHDVKMIKTKEPLLIEGPNGDENYYVLPLGTTLYHDMSFPEGHDRYVVYLNHKGAIAHDEVSTKPEYGGSFIDPLWISNIDVDTLKEIFKRFPLSKEDVVAAIKSNEITRDDLADIIRSLPE
ncbi:Transmembrane protein [Pseudomonas sp. IT-P100]